MGLLTIATSSPLSANGSSTNRESLNNEPATHKSALSIAQPQLSIIDPPAGFSISRVAFTGTGVLASKDMFILSIEAMSYLSQRSYNNVLKARSFEIPQHQENAILIGGPAGNIITKYAVWGMVRALQYMVEQHQYDPCLFELLYETRLVGSISFFSANGLESITGANGTASHEVPRRTPTETSLVIAQPDISSPPIYPIVGISAGLGSFMRLADVMMTIISALSDLAPRQMHDVIHGNTFVSGFPGRRGLFLLNYRESTTDESPIWLTLGFLVYVLKRLEAWYAERGDSVSPVVITIGPSDGFAVVARGRLSGDHINPGTISYREQR